MWERWSLEQFHEEYNYYINLHENNRKQLEIFFRCTQPELPEYIYKHSNFLPEGKTRNLKSLPQYEEETSIDKIFGNTWIFNDNNNTGGQPYAERLARIFAADDYQKLPAIEVIKLPNGTYEALEGNHRLYVHFLKGWPTIKVMVIGTADFSK